MHRPGRATRDMATMKTVRFMAILTPVSGRVVDAHETVAPTGGEPCAAWALELRTRDDQVTLRVGHSGGLVVVLASGSRLDVPAGPLWLGGVRPTRVTTPWLFEEALRAVDPARAPAVELTSPIPFATVHAATLQVGDAVGVRGIVAVGDAEVAIKP